MLIGYAAYVMMPCAGEGAIVALYGARVLAAEIYAAARGTFTALNKN